MQVQGLLATAAAAAAFSGGRLCAPLGLGVRPVACIEPAANTTGSVFDGADWDAAAAPAVRIAEIRRRLARSGGSAPGLPGSDTDWALVLRRAVTSRPLTLLLVLCFGVLTVGDIVFNLSRLFICALPDMCTPAVY